MEGVCIWGELSQEKMGRVGYGAKMADEFAIQNCWQFGCNLLLQIVENQ